LEGSVLRLFRMLTAEIHLTFGSPQKTLFLYEIGVSAESQARMFKLQRLFLLEHRLSSVPVLSACATYSIVIFSKGVSGCFVRECRVLQ